MLKEQEATNILTIDAVRLPNASKPFEIIFMDPPYRRGLVEPTLKTILMANWLSEHGVIVAELASDEDINLPEGLTEVVSRTQGQQKTMFIKRAL